MPQQRGEGGFTLLELMLVLTVFGVLTAIGVATYDAHRERIMYMTAVSDIGHLQVEIGRFGLDNNNQLPATLADIGRGGMLDPWGRPYCYLSFSGLHGSGQMRKDHNLVPLNSDFDLYSMGPDGATQAPLTPKVSHDDIIRANDGRYIGWAKDY